MGAERERAYNDAREHPAQNDDAAYRSRWDVNAVGIPPRAELTSPKQAARFLEMGVKDFCMGTDLYVIYDWMRDNGKALRNLVEEVHGQTSGPIASSNGHVPAGTPDVEDTAEARPPHA